MFRRKFIEGDATQPQSSGNKVIAHICNDAGKWGRGFVMAVSDRWPECRSAYLKWYNERDSNDFELGKVQFVLVDNDIYVANMVAQAGIKSRDNESPLKYDALEECLRIVLGKCKDLDASLHMPRIGSGLAGGDFSVVGRIIEEVFSGTGIEVNIYLFD